MILSCDRALFWKEKKLLIVADTHFGKARIFRKSAIPVPAGTTADDFNRLSVLINQFQPAGLIFLGDLIHGPTESFDEFKRQIDAWRIENNDIELYLATGNHDLKSGNIPSEFRLDYVASELRIDPFLFTHKPKIDSLGYSVTGHIHPCVTVRGKARQRETLPCFCFSSQTLILPAFGSFTGNQLIHPKPADRIYVIAGNEILEMPNSELPTCRKI
jgi:DNA ligase-associated metallophosphoesterase